MKALPILIISIASASLGTAAEAARAPEMPERPVQPSNRVRPVSEGPRDGPKQTRRTAATQIQTRNRHASGSRGRPAGPPAWTPNSGLAPHTGLVVTEVAPNGPAQEKIKLHDVLVELDGQVLINPEQFAVSDSQPSRGRRGGAQTDPRRQARNDQGATGDPRDPACPARTKRTRSEARAPSRGFPGRHSHARPTAVHGAPD
jgi:hypothetical protein